MSTQKVPVSGRFPERNIHVRYGRIHVQSMTATVAMTAPETPFANNTVQVIKVEMSCTGNLDTHTILIEDANILRMFAMKDGSVVIDLSPIDIAITIFALQPTGPIPDNDGESDSDTDFEMLNETWKTCRLVWEHDAGIANLNKQTPNAKRKAELAAQANSAERPRRPAAQPDNLKSEHRRPVYTTGQARTPQLVSRLGIEDGGSFSPSEADFEVDRDGEVEVRSKEESGDSSEEALGDQNEADYCDDDNDKHFEEPTTAKPKRSQSRHKAFKPSQKQLGKGPAKFTSHGAPRKLKPRDPTAMISPRSIITTGTAGHVLRPLMEELGHILTTDAERQEYMDLVWTRRRAALGDDAAKQVVIDDLENFVRRHDIVDLHNLWARWIESGIKTVMPMYKLVGTGEMDAAERLKMFERKKKARRG